MKIKHIITAALLAVTSTTAFADSNVNKYGIDTKICDLALIYAGDTKRPDWTKENLTPYVTHKYADGSESWLFDGFLFLEFNRTAVNRTFGNGSKYLDPAIQEDWQWLIDVFFTPDRRLDALDQLIEDKKATLGEPPLRHKVVLSLCAPTKNTSDSWSREVWGYVNGKGISMATQASQLTAVKWYIDQILKRWDAAGFKNIDLEGFYWIEESLSTNGNIMPTINDYIHEKGLRSYWIPYYLENQTYYSKWSDVYKFDMAYLQPGYAFYDNTGHEKPYSQLTNAVDEAKRYGMGLELEFETQEKSNALHSVNQVLHKHINDYMDVFDAKRVFSESGVAYYTGTQGLIHMDQSTDPVDHQTMDRMARYVVARQKARAAESASITDAVADTPAIAYVRDNTIVILSDTAVCHDIAGRLIFEGPGEIACQSGIYIVSDNAGHSVKLLVK